MSFHSYITFPLGKSNEGVPVFVVMKKITAGSGNLKNQTLRTSGSGVSPNPHQRTSGFHERPGSFPGSYSTCSKQRDHPQSYTHRLFDHHGYISKPDIFFLDNCGYQREAWRGFGLLSDTRHTLVFRPRRPLM